MKSRQWEASVTDKSAVNAALVLKLGTKSWCFLEKLWKSRCLCQWGHCTEWLQPITRASHNQHCRRSSAKFSLLFQMASFFLKSWTLKEHLMRLKLPIAKSSFLDSINHKIEMNVKQGSRVYRLDVQVINFFNTHLCSIASFPLTHPCLHSYGKFTWSVKERKGRKRLNNIRSPGFPWHCSMALLSAQVPSPTQSFSGTYTAHTLCKIGAAWFSSSSEQDSDIKWWNRSGVWEHYRSTQKSAGKAEGQGPRKQSFIHVWMA